MKICLFGPSSSVHLAKLGTYLAERGHEVHVVSFLDSEIPGCRLHHIEIGVSGEGSDGEKLKYLTSAGRVKKIIKEIAPDIINVHYATSYGATAALAGLGKYILSVWGSDIFEFPRKSPLHKNLLKFSLNSASLIFSTSVAMGKETRKYTKRPIEITQFGVDENLFTPEKRARGEASDCSPAMDASEGSSKKDASDNDFVVGTVKGLSETYGIDILLEAVAAVKADNPDIPIKCRIAGKGPQEDELKSLATALELDDVVTWLGFISQEEAAKEWANMDLALIPSRRESYGVAAIEAQASGIPVIISDIPGLNETIREGETGVVIPSEDIEALKNEIIALYHDKDRRLSMGKRGREFVLDRLTKDLCFSNIEKLYEGFKQ